MEFSEYGQKDGQLVVYFHGAPGAIEECAIFNEYAKKNNLRIICFDRFSLADSYNRAGYYQQIATSIKREANGKPLDIVGFSIGTHVALEVIRLLKDQVHNTHLISVVAPINAGPFIDNMAGGMVFKLAMEKPAIFWLLTKFQQMMAVLAPKILVSMLFASSVGEDKILSKKGDFRRYITPLLKNCFKRRTKGYMRDVNFYVKWQGDFSDDTSNVYLWHGTKDNWSPLTMATYLCDSMSGTTGIQSMEGLSHYTALFEAAPQICAQLKNPQQPIKGS